MHTHKYGTKKIHWKRENTSLFWLRIFTNIFMYSLYKFSMMWNRPRYLMRLRRSNTHQCGVYKPKTREVGGAIQSNSQGLSQWGIEDADVSAGTKAGGAGPLRMRVDGCSGSHIWKWSVPCFTFCSPQAVNILFPNKSLMN